MLLALSPGINLVTLVSNRLDRKVWRTSVGVVDSFDLDWGGGVHSLETTVISHDCIFRFFFFLLHVWSRLKIRRKTFIMGMGGYHFACSSNGTYFPARLILKSP